MQYLPKGDAARTHAGVIAQQVQTAMSDAGLDSSKYGFWCSDTWWEVTEEIAAKEAVFHEDGSLSHPEEPAFTQKETYTKKKMLQRVQQNAHAWVFVTLSY